MPKVYLFLLTVILKTSGRKTELFSVTRMEEFNTKEKLEKGTNEHM